MANRVRMHGRHDLRLYKNRCIHAYELYRYLLAYHFWVGINYDEEIFSIP